jgi:3-oxoacyl-[acyl-carrier protein] reductase
MSKSKNFFLTGCASGIGQHLADRLIAEGHCVWATDINIDALAQHAQKQGWDESRVQVRRLDVRDSEDWERSMSEAVATFGSIDVHLNIAGYLVPHWFYEASADEVHRHFDINTKGVIFGTQVAARQMMKQKYGHIINISSMSGAAPIAGMAIYGASKYAVRGFSLAAAQELRPHNIFVTAICPDAVNTPLLTPHTENEAGAMLYSNPHLLSTENIGDAILKKALRKKPMELLIPGHRGALARIVDLFPTLSLYVAPIFQNKGRKAQQQMHK